MATKLDLGGIGEPPEDFTDEQKGAWYELVGQLAPENRSLLYRSGVFVMATKLVEFRNGELDQDRVRLLFDYFREFQLTPQKRR